MKIFGDRVTLTRNVDDQFDSFSHSLSPSLSHTHTVKYRCFFFLSVARCSCNSPGGDSCQHASRKRRRGMIEKKRRDRINASLGELRRLVPAAARDPHSGKLEKAEILQLTVEHLRTLRNKGKDLVNEFDRLYLGDGVEFWDRVTHTWVIILISNFPSKKRCNSVW